jgi:hypothetical protein
VAVVGDDCAGGDASSTSTSTGWTSASASVRAVHGSERHLVGRERRGPGLSAQVPDLQRELLEIVDTQVEMSRAGLRREVARLLRLRAGELGQAGWAGA